MNSRTLVTMDREDDDGVEKCLGKLYGMKRTFKFDLFFLLFCMFLTLLLCRGYVHDLTWGDERVFNLDASLTTTNVHSPTLL